MYNLLLSKICATYQNKFQVAFNIKFDTITLRIKCKYACNLEMGKTLINSDGLGCVPPGRCVAFMSSIDFLGFPGGSAVINLPAVQEIWVPSLSREDLPEKEMAAHFSILACETHGQRSLVRYSPWVRKESDTA